MKNTVTIALNDEKVSALKMYLAQKNSTLDSEVTHFSEQLYGKIVPLRKPLMRGIRAALGLSLYDFLSYRTCGSSST